MKKKKNKNKKMAKSTFGLDILGTVGYFDTFYGFDRPVKLDQVPEKAHNHTFAEFGSFFVCATSPCKSMPSLH